MRRCTRAAASPARPLSGWSRTAIQFTGRVGDGLVGVWPFEGRQEELAAIERAVTVRAADAVVLVGPAGVGKTRLTQQAVRLLGDRVEWVAATKSMATIPFGAVAHLLPPTLPSGGGPVELMRAIVSHLPSRHPGARL